MPENKLAGTTAREMSALIGTHVFLEPVPGLRFRTRVTNAKQSYGRQRVEIEAIEGEGRAWVNVASVKPCYVNGVATNGGTNAAQ